MLMRTDYTCVASKYRENIKTLQGVIIITPCLYTIILICIVIITYEIDWKTCKVPLLMEILGLFFLHNNHHIYTCGFAALYVVCKIRISKKKNGKPCFIRLINFSVGKRIWKFSVSEKKVLV